MTHTLALNWPACQAPDVKGSAIGQVVPVSLKRDRVRPKSLICITCTCLSRSVLGVHCVCVCWDVTQPNNQATNNTFFVLSCSREECQLLFQVPGDSVCAISCAMWPYRWLKLSLLLSGCYRKVHCRCLLDICGEVLSQSATCAAHTAIKTRKASGSGTAMYRTNEHSL